MHITIRQMLIYLRYFKKIVGDTYQAINSSVL